MADYPFDPLSTYVELPEAEMEARSRAFAADMQRRRTTRHFSDRTVSRTVIEACIETAGTAPSGAHVQPWHFVAVSDPEVKSRIRVAAEREEREFYATAPAEWLAALAPLGTDAHKPYLETAPWLIVVFAQRYRTDRSGTRWPNYYVTESVGIATGFLLAALHHAGLVALTHTPSPMGFLGDVLERPKSEKALMIVVTGFPAADARVPRLRRKALHDIATFR
jgi:nitroreductase